MTLRRYGRSMGSALAFAEPKDAPVLAVTPTRLAELLRRASKEALAYATDPYNHLDNNPFISREWAIVSTELWSLASRLDVRFLALFRESGVMV
jgi:hypothetical protein